jgi:hypothetical protein
MRWRQEDLEFKATQKKEGWGHNSNGRGPGFNPLYYQKRKKIELLILISDIMGEAYFDF